MALVVDRNILNKPREKFWISYIKQRIKRNKNMLCQISGPTGSGKSWSSLSIAEQLDEEFNIDRVVFSGKELMQLINSGNLKSGSVIIFEEAGIGLSNKNWQSTVNKMLNFLIQTFRHRNFILIFNSPYMDFIDAGTRKLFHAELECVGINQSKQTTRLKARTIQYNSRSKKFYFKMLRVVTPKGVIPVNYWNVDKPSSALIEQYEVKKRTFTDQLNETIQFELEEYDKKNNNTKELTQKQQLIVDHLKNGLTVPQIAELTNVCNQTMYSNIRLIKKKGFKIKPIRDYESMEVLKYEVIEP